MPAGQSALSPGWLLFMLRGNLKPPTYLRCWLLLALLYWTALSGLAGERAVLPSGPAAAESTSALELSECALSNDTPAYLYTGEQIDPDLGMYYLRARYYQPATGRFWNMDSFEGRQNETLSLHKYLYCQGNPINGSDPSGHEFSLGGISASSSIGSSLGSFHNGVVASIGSAMQASITGTMAGKAMNEILSDYVLDETGISAVLNLAGALGSYFRGGQSGADLAFRLHLDSYALPLLMGIDTGLEEANAVYAAPQCLIGGTFVDTADGLKKIETIQKGDLVWAWNEESAKRELKPVLNTFMAHRDAFFVIEVGTVVVVATPEHPFFIQTKSWKRADQLKAGESLFSEAHPEGQPIKAIKEVRRPTVVYNMEVKGLHNYFVTSEGILTHNTGAGHHHFFPKTFGSSLNYGERALTAARYLTALRHTEVHKDLSLWLKNYRGMNLMPRPGRKGTQIVSDVGLPVIEQALREFYALKFPHMPHYLKLFEEEARAIKRGLSHVP